MAILVSRAELGSFGGAAWWSRQIELAYLPVDRAAGLAQDAGQERDIARSAEGRGKLDALQLGRGYGGDVALSVERLAGRGRADDLDELRPQQGERVVVVVEMAGKVEHTEGPAAV